MSVTLSEVKRAAKAHRAPLAGESAGYLVLAIADQVLSAPRLVQATDIQLTEDGGLRVLSGRASSDAEAELALRQALDALLLVASSGSAALTRASRRTSPLGLPALVRELEAALIPVNRSAARRALARLHRETARALSSGVLPAEDSSEASPLAPVATALPVVAVAPVAPVALKPASPLVPVVAAPLELELEPESDLELELEPETREIRVASDPAPGLPPLSAEMDAMLTALCAEAPEPELEAADDSDALTIALDVRALGAAVPEPELEFDVDVEFEAHESESGAAPTVVRDAPVAPIAHSAALMDEPADMPVEACTRPEPVVLRRSLRPEPALAVPTSAELSPVSEPMSHTPTLGSLAALPVLAPALFAELSAIAIHTEEAVCLESIAPPVAAADLVICSAAMDECTEPMPEVAPLAPGVAIVASRKSDVSELLSSFQVADDDSNQGLCRAIKEMAGLDLTPAPFAALIR
jgi:hypothetical protein